MPRPFRPRSGRQARLLGGAIALILRLLGATWRLRLIGEDRMARGEVALGALWHRDALIAAWYFRDRRIVVPVSLSRDGQVFDAGLGRLGYARSARGSSSRRATGLLREMIRSVRAGSVVAVLPDGPQGPARRAKPGVVAVAAAGGVPIVPVAFSARWAIRGRSWDRTLIPLPWSRVLCRWGEPLAIPRRLDDDGRQTFLKELERRLDALRVEVDEAAGAAPDPPPPAPEER